MRTYVPFSGMRMVMTPDCAQVSNLSWMVFLDWRNTHGEFDVNFVRLVLYIFEPDQGIFKPGVSQVMVLVVCKFGGCGRDGARC